MVRSLEEVGIVYNDSTVVTKVVQALPDEDYYSFKQAWDSVADADQTMDRLLARLKKKELEIKSKTNQETTGSSEATQSEAVAVAVKAKSSYKGGKQHHGNIGSQDKNTK